MSFRRQVVSGHAALVGLVLVVGVVSAVALRLTTGRLARVVHELGDDMRAIQQLRYRAEQVAVAGRGFLHTGNLEMLARFDRAVERVGQSLATLDGRPELAEELVRVDAAADDYIATARTAARERAAADPRDAAAYFERMVAPARDRFETALNALASHEQRALEDATDRSQFVADESQLFVTVATAFAVLFASCLAWLSSRRLSAQYVRERRATELARRATAARDEILEVVSHDLRNPLTAITMGAAVLAETSDSPFVRGQSAKIGDSATRMAHLIDQLLDVAQLERGKLELVRATCRVGELFASLASMFELRAAALGIELSFEGDAVVDADPERLLQILANLIGNSLKLTPRGGRVAVVVRRDGAVVRFEVADTGPGIAPELVPHLFDRYWQRRSRERGSLGLGLYICKQLVTAHGGDIGVRSTVGEGATFWFAIPWTPTPSVGVNAPLEASR